MQVCEREDTLIRYRSIEEAVKIDYDASLIIILGYYIEKVNTYPELPAFLSVTLIVRPICSSDVVPLRAGLLCGTAGGRAFPFFLQLAF